MSKKCLRKQHQQMRLSIKTGAGGVGKTTLATNLGYEMAILGYKVAIFDLDPQASINVFCRLDKNPKPIQTTAWIYSSDFDGNYPLIPVWTDYTKNLEVCQGSDALFKIIPLIYAHSRGSYLLKDHLEDFPLDHDLIIFDCPATLEPIPMTALAASTHVLVPLEPAPKESDGTRLYAKWFDAKVRELRLSPSPEILGFVINGLKDWSEHVRLAEQLPPQYERRGFHCFPPINEYAEFVNACSRGVPLRVHRPNHPGVKQLQPIVQAIQNIIGV